MPYASRRQARWAHATDQPFAKRWDKLTSFAVLPEHKDAGADAGTPLHGPGGLLGTPGMGGRRARTGRKWGQRLKDSGYGARAGETIRGNLGRSTSGKFTRVGAPISDAPPQFGKGAHKKPKGRRRAGAKPKQTPEQRAAATAQKRQQNAAAVAKRMADTDTGLSPSGSKALLAFASGTQPDAQTGAGLAKLGLAEQASDGSYRMTPTGHAAVSAMQSGDYQRAVDAISRGTDAAGKRTQRGQERTARQQASAAKRQAAEQARAARREQVQARRTAKQPAKARSGGTAPTQRPEAAAVAPTPAAPPKRHHTPVPSASASSGATPKKPAAKPEPAPAKQISPALRDAASALSEGADVSDEQIGALVRNGLVKLNKDGEPVLTAAGLRATMKAETYGGTKRSNLAESVFAGPDRSFPIKTAQDVHDAVRSLGRTKHDKEAVKKGIIRRARAIGATDALPEDWRTTTKAQSDQEKAMFANMGGGGGGGSGGGGKGGKPSGGQGGLWARGPSGKRTPQAGPASGGGGAKGDSKPKETDDQRMDREQRDRATALRDKRDETQRKMRMNTDPSQTQPLFNRWRELDDAVQSNVRSGHISEADAKPLRDNSSTARIPMPKARNSTADKQRTALHQDAQKQRALAATYPKGSAGHQAAEARLREIGEKLNHIDDTTIKPKKTKSFIVFKDHTGAHRWLARTTTAYRDRDQEIISSDALDADSQRMTAQKQFGPLRYWHVGQPDPLNVAQPWGPGLDIGDCDYSVLIGRTRVESGTFRDPRIAQKIAQQADTYELSPGFFHPLDQPDTGGVFHAIRTFERSIVPTAYGRASNLFTGLAVKEQRMDISEMEKRFKTAITDLGLNAEQATALGMQLVQTEKDASAQGIAFKSDDAAVGTPEYPDVVINGVTYKAAPPPPAMDAEDDPAMGGDSGVDEAAEGEPPIDDGQMAGDYLGDMSWDEFATKLGALLAPVLKMQDMVKSIGDAHNELKSMYGGQATKDDARAQELTALKAQYRELADKITQIEGDQPAVVLPDDVASALKSAGPAAPAQPDDAETAAALNDPTRPYAAIAARTMPNLYRSTPDGGFAGWTPPQAP